MKVGVYLGSHHPAHTDMRGAFEHHLQEVRLIRKLGFKSLFVAQHYVTYPDQFFQPTPLLARLAGEAEGMMLGTNILILPLHNIIDIAEQFAALDIICNGRLVLGVAIGFRDEEFAAFGIDRQSRGERFEEQVDALKLLWSADNASFEGRFVHFDAISLRPRPLQRPRPPIWIGGESRPGIRRAALKGDAWISSPTTPFALLKDQVALFRLTRRDAGLPPADVVSCVEVCIGDSRSDALQKYRPYIARKYAAYSAWGVGRIGANAFDASTEVDDLVEKRFIVGSPEDCIRQCSQRGEKLGLSHLIVRLVQPGMPPKETMEAYRRFGEEVLPAIVS